MKNYKIASIPGDGIGKEFITESFKVLKKIENSTVNLIKRALLYKQKRTIDF